MAAFVPASRGLSWQLEDPAGNAIVRERYWLSFRAGEIRSCTSCHGVNSVDQAGHTVATNPPRALRELLESWKETHPEADAGSFRVWSEGLFGATLDPAADTDGDGATNFEEFALGSSPLARPVARRAEEPARSNSPSHQRAGSQYPHIQSLDNRLRRRVDRRISPMTWDRGRKPPTSMRPPAPCRGICTRKNLRQRAPGRNHPAHRP